MLARSKTLPRRRLIDVHENPVEIDQLAAFEHAVQDVPESFFYPPQCLFRLLPLVHAYHSPAHVDRLARVVVEEFASAKNPVDTAIPPDHPELLRIRAMRIPRDLHGAVQ